MLSLKSRLIYLAIRHRHLFRFHLRREVWDEHTSIAQFREDCEAGARKAGKLPDGIEVTPITIDTLPAGLAAEWIHPSSPRPFAAPGQPVIFYTLGGGYVSGSCSDHRSFVANLVHHSGIGALIYEYRLAPEHPYPAAVEDSLAAYRWLLAQGVSLERLVIVGESAGGGLALCLLLALRDLGLPLPAAAVAMSPYTDLTCSGDSHQTRRRQCISPVHMSQVCAAHYAGTHDPREPWISPLYGDLHGLPPLYISVGDYEVMLDDSTRFAAKAETAGVDVTLKVGPGMTHCYPLMASLFPEATEAIQEMCAFIQKHAGAKGEQMSAALEMQPTVP